MTFTDDAWRRTATIRAAIDDSEFLRQLGDGTLPAATFRHYLEQDVIYLAGYARALALLAAQAPEPAAAGFWARSAHTASLVETSLHGDLLTSGLLPPTAADRRPYASPSTLGYVSYLVATAATAPYPVAVAGVLPCFWIYADVAHRLARGAAVTQREGGHPYARWIATYDATEFWTSVQTAIQLTDDAADAAAADVRERMHEAFGHATRYELMFWETAYAFEDWPLPLAAAGALAGAGAAPIRS